MRSHAFIFLVSLVVVAVVMLNMISAYLAAFCLVLHSSPPLASAIPYSSYILAPSSRTIRPVSIHAQTGSVQSPGSLLQGGSGSTTFAAANASITFDFGKNIAGRVSFNVDAVSGYAESLAFTFTESSLYISTQFCDGGPDLPLVIDTPAAGSYTPPHERLRGGFRYMSVVHNSAGSVQISNLTIAFSAEPTMADPSDYTGYFHSNSEKLNRVWYAGAYTNQLCIIDPTEGQAVDEPIEYWYNNVTLSSGSSVLVDGAKRDRLIWPGDIAVSGPSIYVSTANTDPTKNGLSLLFSQQQSNGQLPYVGANAKYSSSAWSFTYHLHTLIDLYDYYLFTGDVAYLTSLWDKFKLAMAYSLSTIDSTGLGDVTTDSDWLRGGMGGHNIEANAIFFAALGAGVELAAVLGDTSVTAQWTAARNGIQTAANALLFDASQSLFKDNENSTVYPQDGNSYALLSGLVNDPARASAISAALAARWIKPYGAPAPEAGATISPFASGFEIRAHYAAGHAERAVELMEFMWADFMLDDPRMTNSTFIEGYSTDGRLAYLPYGNKDARLSYAHGWATTPTFALTQLGVGLTYSSAAGKTWTVKPALGGLTSVAAGFTTPLGLFTSSWGEGGRSGEFETPAGTSGSLSVAAIAGTSSVAISGPGGSRSAGYDADGVARFAGLAGGYYKVTVT